MFTSHHLFVRTARAARLGLLLALGAGSAGAQVILHVDDDGPGDPAAGNPFISDPAEDGSALHPFDRIQEAIDAALSGDTIQVQPGLYFDLATIDLSSSVGGAPKDLYLLGVGGSDVTTVDGTALGASVMRAIKGETSQYVVEGLTLRGGDPGFAVGDNGGGAEILDSSPTFRACVFDSNAARIGGAAYVHDSSSRFEDCRFVDNYADWQGGAIYQDRGNLTFERCTFDGNEALAGGGAMINRSSNPAGSITVRDSLFVGNRSDGSGGGMAKWDAFPMTVERTRFVSNESTAGGGGGGLFVNGGGTVRDCLFNSNVSGNGQGGGLNNWSGGTVTVTGSTFTNNEGNGIWVFSGSTASVTNSILWDDFPAEISGSATVRYSDVMGAFAGTGNIADDPRFLDPWGVDGTRGTLDDDLHVSLRSPCIDAGDTLVAAVPAPMESYPVDLDGKARAADRSEVDDSGVAVLGLTVDMGAYEAQTPKLLFQQQTP